MSRGFNHFNRTFTAKEPGIQPIPSTEEKGSHWHRADIMRLRFHPGFRIPLDGPIGTTNKQGPSFVLLCSNRFEIMAPAGLSMIELFVNEQYKTHIEYLDEQPTAVSFSLEEIGQRCGWRANQKLSIEATCVNQTQKRIENMTEFFTSGQVRLPGMNGNVIKSDGYGLGGLGGASKYSSVFYRNGRPKQLRQINVHHGSFLDGFVLIWQDGTHDTIGKTGGGLSRFSIQNGESIRGFHIHSGAWVDGLQFILSSGRLSDWYGGKGGSLSTVVAPQGHHLVGFYGTAGQWMDQLGVYYQQST
jgi:hypothetical protein